MLPYTLIFKLPATTEVGFGLKLTLEVQLVGKVLLVTVLGTEENVLLKFHYLKVFISDSLKIHTSKFTDM